MNLSELESKAKAAPQDWELLDYYDDAAPLAATLFVRTASPDLLLRMCAALREVHHNFPTLVSAILARHGLELE